MSKPAVRGRTLYVSADSRTTFLMGQATEGAALTVILSDADLVLTIIHAHGQLFWLAIRRHNRKGQQLFGPVASIPGPCRARRSTLETEERSHLLMIRI